MRVCIRFLAIFGSKTPPQFGKYWKIILLLHSLNFQISVYSFASKASDAVGDEAVGKVEVAVGMGVEQLRGMADGEMGNVAHLTGTFSP